MSGSSAPHDASVAQLQPLHADALTRCLYAVALAGLVVASLAAASPGIGTTLAYGLIAHTGRDVFLVLAAAVVYRVYTVARYPSALDARPPWPATRFLRAGAQLVMAAGAAGTVSLFLVKPLALLIFKDPGDNNIAYYLVGLVATLLAAAGPFGCALFELSRVLGRKVPLTPARDRPRRRQDFAVMGGVALLVVIAIAVPPLRQAGKGPVSGRMFDGRCVARLMLECAAKVEGDVHRMAAVPVGGAVRLRANFDAIEYRHPDAKRGTVLLESVVEMVSRAGYRVAPEGEVLVEVEAITIDGAPVIKLRVSDAAGVAALFTNTFARGAKWDSARRRVVVDVSGNVMLPLFGKDDANGNRQLADGLYGQLRRAVGSEREAAVSATAQTRSAAEILASTPAADYKYRDARIAPNCTGSAGRHPQDAPEKSMPPLALPLSQISFRAPGRTAILNAAEYVTCHDDTVWFVRHDGDTRVLYIRRHDLEGTLQRAWRVKLPIAPPNTSRYPEPDSLREEGGHMRLRMLVYEGVASPTPRLVTFSFAP